MKKVLLILPAWNSGLSFHHGLQYVSASMTQAGIENDIMILDEPECLPVMLELLDEGYDTIGATSTSFEFPKLNNLIGKMQEFNNDNITYMLGGVHGTVTNDIGNFDICHVGEYPCYQDNLDNLPDYLDGKMPLQQILDAKDGWLQVIVSRGCPFACSYCINSLNPQSVRRMTVDKAIDHISAIVKSLDGVKVINLDDDNLALDKVWLGEFLNKFKIVINKPYVINLRAQDMTDEVAELLKDTGCLEIQIGVECGDEDTRRTVLNKKTSNDIIIKAFDVANRYNLRTLAYIMHGIPFVGNDSVVKTAELVKRIKPTLVRDTYFYPFEGTAIRNTCTNAGLHICDSDNYFDHNCFTNSDGEKELFRQLLKNDYHPYKNNCNYLEKNA